MNARTRIFLTVCLPALALPFMLAVSSTAEAASLDISNGLRSAKDVTSVGFDYTVDAAGTAVVGNKSYATSVSLDCSFDNSNEALDCVGIMTLGNTQADIVFDVHGDTQKLRWAVEAGAPTALQNIHELWAEEVIAQASGQPYGWEVLDYYAGGGWTVWYYSTTWAETVAALGGIAFPATF